MLAVALASTSLIAAGATTAYAADGCGTNWHKQEDGDIYNYDSASRDGRTITGRVSGKVRWCTREKTLRDHFFQKVIVGVPEAVDFRSTFSGGRTQICSTASFTAKISGGASSEISIGTDGVSATITTPSETTKTVTLPKKCFSGDAATNNSWIGNAMYNFSAAAPNDSLFGVTCPYISAVTVSVVTSVTYRVNGGSQTLTQKVSNTDVPNDLPTIGC